MEGVFGLFKLPVGEKIEKGEAKLSTYEFKHEENPLYNLRATRNGGSMFWVADGKYVRLHVGNELMMSDTRMERTSNYEFCYYAHGRVLIAGLGIGLILHNLRDKIQKGDITEILVIEKSQDVIDIVAPYFLDIPQIKIFQGDVFEWKPAPGEKFNTLYFDIWPTPTIDTDNLQEISKLHNKFKYFKDRTDPRCYMDSWMREYLQKQKRKDSRNSYW
jgi:hypothetical protein